MTASLHVLEQRLGYFRGQMLGSRNENDFVSERDPLENLTFRYKCRAGVEVEASFVHAPEFVQVGRGGRTHQLRSNLDDRSLRVENGNLGSNGSESGNLLVQPADIECDAQ